MLDDDSLAVGFVTSTPVDETVQTRYSRAVKLMRNRLARDDERSFLACDWPLLENSLVFEASGLRVDVSLPLSRGEYELKSVAVDAFHSRQSGLLCQYYQQIVDLGAEAGSQAVAVAFPEEIRLNASLLWFWAWIQAESVSPGYYHRPGR